MQVDLKLNWLEINPPPNSIQWSVPDHTITPNSQNATLSWSTPGTRQIVITVFGLTKRVVIDIPDVGTISQYEAATLDPYNAAAALIYANEAADWASTAIPGDDATQNGKANALRHSYWNALMASDFLIGPAEALLFSTAHEFTDKQNGGVAYDSTMDLHNNYIGSLSAHSTVAGTPSRDDIKQELLNRLATGDLWIVAEISQTEIGHVIKSNGKKIFPLN